MYEPVAAFERVRQRHWLDYAKSNRAVPTNAGPARQRELIFGALGATWSALPQEDEAYLLWPDKAHSGSPLVCPWNLRVRVAEAALEVREGVPPVLADAFVPPALAEAAQVELSGWRKWASEAPDRVVRLHEETSNWIVPIRWFTFFAPDEREVFAKPDLTVRLRAPMALARRRGHKALSVLRQELEDAPVTSELAGTVRWLEDFHPGSVLELDYGGLVELIPEEKIFADRSVELVEIGLTAMGQGELTQAGVAYEELVEFWRDTQLLERCN